jgi:UPF0755 protein
LVLGLCALVTVVGLGQRAVDETFDGPSDMAHAVDVVIPAGDTARVAAGLRRDGVIVDPLLFRVAVWVTRGDGPIHAGEFLIPARASLRALLGILRHGAPVQHEATIPEGLTAIQIAKLINALPAATGVVAPPAEGAVLPQTYDYVFGARREAILRRAEAAGAAALDAAWRGRDRSIVLVSPAQALTLASIVQEETPVAAELPKVAAVYENRLARGMDLQADPTVIYAASGGAEAGGQPITRAELARDSAYNTYVHGGLPPGPICAPGVAALDAVLHPAVSDALFFVATGTGGHVFSDNFKQHLANVAAYRAAVGH